MEEAEADATPVGDAVTEEKPAEEAANEEEKELPRKRKALPPRFKRSILP